MGGAFEAYSKPLVTMTYETLKDHPLIDATTIGKDVAMQIAALHPRFWAKSLVTEDVIAEEKKVLVAQMDNDPKMASKPQQVKEKIAACRLNKFYEENCLLQQAFVKDGDVSVEQ